MTYWKIAPGPEARDWETQCNEGYIGIRWSELGDMRNADRNQYNQRRQELADQLGRPYDGQSNVWRFIRDIKIGDIIIANRGNFLIVGVGTVTGEPTYVDNVEFCNRRTVNWGYINNQGYQLQGGQFAQATLTRIINQEMIGIANNLLTNPDQEQENNDQVQVTNDPVTAGDWLKRILEKNKGYK
jgi:predicted Mrr-cat superfamily restriction endonuclease